MAKRDERGVKVLDYSGMKQASGNYDVLVNADDVSAILQTGIKAISCQARYPNNDEGLANFKKSMREYFQYIDQKNAELDGIEGSSKLIPDIEGACIFAGISKPTLYSYEDRDGSWKDTIEILRTTIGAVKKQLAFSYKIPPVVAIFDLCNNHHYRNTNTFNINTNTTPEQQEAIRLENDISEIGLKWDEQSGEFLPDGKGV